MALAGMVRVMLADGIGHGRRAHRIVTLLLDHLDWISHRATEPLTVAESMDSLHIMLLEQGMEAQAAVALLDIQTDRNSVAVVSVGNIDVQYLASGTSLSFPSMRGMVGGIYPRQLKVSHQQMEDRSLLCLMSDGVDAARTRAYLHQLHQRHPGQPLQVQREAEAIVEDFGSLSDDASCVLIQALAGERP